MNESESYGVELEVKRLAARQLRGSRPMEIHHVLEEQYHSRILREACRTCGVDAEMKRPPRGMRVLIWGMQYLPASLRYIPLLCGEVLSCVIFARLLEGTRLFRDQPEVEERLRRLLTEILRDETLHALYCQTRLGPLGLRVARSLVPLVAASFGRDGPELAALGGSRRQLVAAARRGLELPSGLGELVPVVRSSRS